MGRHRHGQHQNAMGHAHRVVAMGALGDARRMKVYIAGGLRSVGAMVDALGAMDGASLGGPAAAEPRLVEDMGTWYQKTVEDGDKMEFVRAVEFSAPVRVHEVSV